MHKLKRPSSEGRQREETSIFVLHLSLDVRIGHCMGMVAAENLDLSYV